MVSVSARAFHVAVQVGNGVRVRVRARVGVAELSLGFIDWCDSGFSYFYFDSHLLFWTFCCCCCCCTRLAVSLFFFSSVCLSFLNFYHIFGYAAGQTGCHRRCRCRSNVQRKWCGRCSTLDCFLAVAIAVYIRFWLDLCHLINQTNTARKPKPREGRGTAGRSYEACVVCSSLRQLQPDPNTHTYIHRDKYVCVCLAVGEADYKKNFTFSMLYSYL